MSADADAACNAAYGERTDERTNKRNGYRSRRWDTRVGTATLRSPISDPAATSPTGCSSLAGAPRRHSSRSSPTATSPACPPVGSTSSSSSSGSTRSKSQVSKLAKELDQIVEAFRSRPLDGAPYAYVWFDAHTEKVREDGRIVSVSVVKAIGVNRAGIRGPGARRCHRRGRRRVAELPAHGGASLRVGRVSCQGAHQRDREASGRGFGGGEEGARGGELENRYSG